MFRNMFFIVILMFSSQALAANPYSKSEWNAVGAPHTSYAQTCKEAGRWHGGQIHMIRMYMLQQAPGPYTSRQNAITLIQTYGQRNESITKKMSAPDCFHHAYKSSRAMWEDFLPAANARLSSDDRRTLSRNYWRSLIDKHDQHSKAPFYYE